jgi:hypothetical protein
MEPLALMNMKKSGAKYIMHIGGAPGGLPLVAAALYAVLNSWYKDNGFFGHTQERGNKNK